MNIAAEAKALETRACRAGLSMPDVLARAKVNRSTWDRWKAGNYLPQMRLWRAIIGVIERRERAVKRKRKTA